MNERVARIMNHPLRVPITIGVLSFASGVSVGFYFGKRKRFPLHVVPDNPFGYSEETLAELEDIRKEVDEIIGSDDTPGTVIIDAEVLIEKGGEFVAEKLKEGVSVIDEEVIEETIPHSIFAESDGEWNYEEELKSRSSSAPYIIHKDEFYADELDYTQTTLTYYAGDDIMADEDDKPVYNFNQLIGPLMFGHGSGDPKVFYVRNDKRKAEYEIINIDGLFSEEVLGLEIEDNQRVKDIKHSSLHKFRPDD